MQTQAVHGKNMVQNNAGGFVFAVDNFQRLERFLILGSDKNTYYQAAKELTIENALCVIDCASEDIQRTVDTIVNISRDGRAPKREPALFALALILGHESIPAESRRLAAESVWKVCGTQTDVNQFVNFATKMRGWGSLMCRAVALCYEKRSVNDVAYHGVKYRQRDGWTHRDLLLKAHVKTSDPVRNTIYQYLAEASKPEDRRKEVELPNVPASRIIEGYEKARKASTSEEVVSLISEYNLTREMVPTQFLNDVGVCRQLLQKMPMTALLRSLGLYTSNGTIAHNSPELDLVIEKFGNEELIQRSKLHPIAILNAMNVYSKGSGEKTTWTPIGKIVKALNDAFYMSFKNVVPTGKRILIALDVSGSMQGASVSGLNAMSAREASAAMCMTTLRTEKNCEVIAFSRGITPIPLHDGMTINEVTQKISGLPFDTTDCAQPMIWAKKNRKEFDAFIIYTDNETYSGDVHPYAALKDYRASMVPDAKLAVVAFSGTNFSIADPEDAGSMDFVGFDSAAPSILSNFIAS